jgi:hypothetical protein
VKDLDIDKGVDRWRSEIENDRGLTFLEAVEI